MWIESVWVKIIGEMNTSDEEYAEFEIVKCSAAHHAELVEEIRVRIERISL